MLAGDYSAGVTLAAGTIVNVDTILLTAGHSYKLVLNDATSTTPLTVNGVALGAGESVIVDGSAETSAQLILVGGAGDDMLTGGAGNNILVSGAGVDTLIGGGASDQYTLRGNLTAADQIDGKAGTDVVTLSGNYSAGVVFTATTMINVEGLQLTGAFDYKLTFDDATATPIMISAPTASPAGTISTSTPARKPTRCSSSPGPRAAMSSSAAAATTRSRRTAATTPFTAAAATTRSRPRIP